MRQLRGTGTIRRRGNRWECRIRVAGQQISVYRRTQTEAQAKADEARREHRQIRSQTPTVREWLGHWLERTRDALAVSTWTTYERHGRRYIVPVIGDVRLDMLTPDHIDRLHANAARRVSGNSVAQVHRTLSIALNAAGKREHRVSSAHRVVERAKSRKREITPLRWHEVGQLLLAAEGDAFEAAYALAVLHGLREGELLGLRWEHLDLTRRTLRAAGTATVNRLGQRVVTSPKTDRARRTLELSYRCVTALIRTPRVGQLVWPGSDGGPIARSTFYKPWLQMCDRADIRRVRFADLRHTAATLAIGDGVPIQLVSKMLGQASPGFTYKTYAHADPSGTAAIVDRINARFGACVRVVRGQ